MASQRKFHWADYLCFAVSFAIPLVVGLVVAIRSKWHKQTTESYLMANRNMNWFLSGISTMASAMSAVMFVSITTEFYYFGLEYIFGFVGSAISIIFPCIFVIPKYFNLEFKVTSAYEYFEHRYSLPVRMLCGFMYCILTIVYMAVMLYVPSLIFTQVADVSIYVAMSIGGVMCLLYTGFGGLKAIVWVDNLQILIILVGFITMAIKGCIDAGGIRHVIWRYKQGQRTRIIDLDPSPWNRHTLWNTVFLLGINFAGYLGTHQMILQRYLAIPSMRKAQLSVVVASAVILFLGFLCVIIGMSAFAGVGGNEPYLSNQIGRVDQILPYFLMTVMGEAHGIPGLVIAALFAAGLSTMSSGINALAAIFLEDFVRPIYWLKTKKQLEPQTAAWVSRITGVVGGVVVLCLSLGVPSLNDMVISMGRAIEGSVTGPLLGVFICAFFLRYTESWGVFIGMLCSVSWAFFMYISSLRHSQRLNFDQAPMYMANFSVEKVIPNRNGTATLYDVSYTWYVMLDAAAVVVVASVISITIHLVRYGCNNSYPLRKQMTHSHPVGYSWYDLLVAVGVHKWSKPKMEQDSDDKDYKLTQFNKKSSGPKDEYSFLDVRNEDRMLNL